VSFVASLLIWFAIGFVLSLLLFRSAYPHGGGLDAYGCHHDRKAGGYHCHRGPLAGQSFSSKEEMLKKLSADKAETAKSKEKK
jgi:hypothetical protein